MPDIRKTIEHLKELEAKATPGIWLSERDHCGICADNKPVGISPHFRNMAGRNQIRNDFALIVAMRNALPELLQKLQELLPSGNKKLITEWCSECETEVSMYWNVKIDECEAYCPRCGAKLLLCGECIDEHGTCGSRRDCHEQDYACDRYGQLRKPIDYSGGEL